jgi:Dolichyl-phosphate-mannose-protein mannosyltransferase
MQLPAALSSSASPEPELEPRFFKAGVAACTAAVAAFVLLELSTWPPHEDETLALFVGRNSLPHLLHTVLDQRGGAPLHFVLAWVVAHTGGGLIGLRLVSALLAIASVPVLAALTARLAGRAVGLGATALISGSWVLLFHGIYGRMYSLFLFTSALSYLALLHALERGRPRAWLLWGVAILATLATHPYGALVLVSQAAFVLLRRERNRQALLAFVVVCLIAVPLWRSDMVLAGRFQVGVGGGGEKLGAPLPVLRYLGRVAGDFSAGYPIVLGIVLALAAVGLYRLARLRPTSALLTVLVFFVPWIALMVARANGSAAPESRHLIFALPFFSTVVASGVVALVGRRARLAPALAGIALAMLIWGEVAWARHRTPPLFDGEPHARLDARHAAAAWLARTSRVDDILFGYEPIYLGAWELSSRVSHTIVPRADPKLALAALRAAPKPLGRGVWVFDASEHNNVTPKKTIPLRRPYPARQFEAKVFGPYLVIRTRHRTRTIARYLTMASQVEILGKELYIGDADVNFFTVRRAAYQLAR